MATHLKKIESLKQADLEACSIWQYVNADGRHNETAVRPITKIPVKDLSGKLVGTRVKLASGTLVWAILGNIEADNPRLTRHFLTLSVFHKDKLFNMARYHDFDADERGPKALAKFLGLPAKMVFPITYDISKFYIGEPDALLGSIEIEPRERLTRAQIIALAVP